MVSTNFSSIPFPGLATEDLLARCAGFRVRSEDGYLGLVENVQLDPCNGRPVSLSVKVGRIVVFLVPVEAVKEISPEKELVILRPGTTRFGLDTRAASPVAA